MSTPVVKKPAASVAAPKTSTEIFQLIANSKDDKYRPSHEYYNFLFDLAVKYNKYVCYDYIAYKEPYIAMTREIVEYYDPKTGEFIKHDYGKHLITDDGVYTSVIQNSSIKFTETNGVVRSVIITEGSVYPLQVSKIKGINYTPSDIVDKLKSDESYAKYQAELERKMKKATTTTGATKA